VLQHFWLLGLKNDPLFDRHYKPHGLTELACERRGWAEYVQFGQTLWGWQITDAGQLALAAKKGKLGQGE
jgi:hypothetical protein